MIGYNLVQKCPFHALESAIVAFLIFVFLLQVIATPEQEEAASGKTFWPQYLEPQRNSNSAKSWRHKEKPFVLLNTEIVKKLTTPNITLCGERIIYHFMDFFIEILSLAASVF